MRLKIFSVPLYISYPFLCLVALFIITGEFNGFLYCIFAVIIHESGHLVMMIKYGCLPEKIKISLFEIAIISNTRPQKSQKENIKIIFFGPFANFICFILFYLLYLFSGPLFLPLALANLSVGLFNILPVMSLDGGQLIFLILRIKLSDSNAEKFVNILSFIIIFPLSALGFLVLFNSKYNFSLLIVCVYIIMSLVCRNNRYY